ISGDYGYRKPDPRLFQKALDALQVRPEQALFLGNDLYHDIFGAQHVGMKAIFLSSDQGDPPYQTISPDYTISRFAELSQAVDYFVTLSKAATKHLCLSPPLSLVRVYPPPRTLPN